MKISLLTLVAAFAFAACGGSAPVTTDLHKPCNNGACASGQTCITVITTGTGTPSGSSTCEIPCDNLQCPQDYFCATTNDRGKICFYNDKDKPALND